MYLYYVCHIVSGILPYDDDVIVQCRDDLGFVSCE